MLLMVGCSNNTPTIATYTPPAVQPKILATVYISPTPNAEQQQALAAANPPTATPMVIPTVTATPYVGVFLGEVDSSQDGGAVIPPALLGGPTSRCAGNGGGCACLSLSAGCGFRVTLGGECRSGNGDWLPD